MEAAVAHELARAWMHLAMAVEWLCHAGVGRFFAPWDASACADYDDERTRLAALVARLADAGVLRPERALVIRAAIAAHAEAFFPRATLDDVRRRDEVLRRAALAPSALRDRVRVRVPEAPWPPPEFMAPPPVPTSSWREGR